ncbi:hypothetical protein [Micromonospora sp. DT47]|uniref:hypothetical protein n=1 Tax=Micromonospora sp. DT47 TaxID=3393431 RepID=UPI003CE71FE8
MTDAAAPTPPATTWCRRAVAGGTLCLVLAFVRLRRPGSWWLLPGGVLACLAAGALVPARLY